jgi:hypothetical protein
MSISMMNQTNTMTLVPTLTDVPYDVLWGILESFAYENEYTCSMKLFGNLSMVCRLFRDMCSSNDLWKIIYALTVKNKWIITPQSIHCNQESYKNGYRSCYYRAKKESERPMSGLIGDSATVQIRTKQQYEEFHRNPLHCNYNTCPYLNHDMVWYFMKGIGIVGSRYGYLKYADINEPRRIHWNGRLNDCMCCTHNSISQFAFPKDTLQRLKEITAQCSDISHQISKGRRAGNLSDTYKRGGEEYTRLISLQTEAYSLIKSELKKKNNEWIKQGGNGGRPMGDNICRNPEHYLQGTVKFPDKLINRGSYKDAVLKKRATISKRNMKSSKIHYDKEVESLQSIQDEIQRKIDSLKESKQRAMLRERFAKKKWLETVSVVNRLQDAIGTKKGKKK